MRTKLLLGLALTTSLVGSAYAADLLTQTVGPVAIHAANEAIDRAFRGKAADNAADSDSEHAAGQPDEVSPPPSPRSQSEEMKAKYAARNKTDAQAAVLREQERLASIDTAARARADEEEAAAVAEQERLVAVAAEEDEMKREEEALKRKIEERRAKQAEVKEAADKAAAEKIRLAAEREVQAKRIAEEERAVAEQAAIAKAAKQAAKVKMAQDLETLRAEAAVMNKTIEAQSKEKAQLVEDKTGLTAEAESLHTELDASKNELVQFKERVSASARSALASDEAVVGKIGEIIGATSDAAPAQAKELSPPAVRAKAAFGVKLKRPTSPSPVGQDAIAGTRESFGSKAQPAARRSRSSEPTRQPAWKPAGR